MVALQPESPADLPLPATPLIGRQAKIKAVHQHVSRADVRLLTLTGPPGTGKTRLAIASAGEMSRHFEHGVRFVDLTRITDPALVHSSIAERLGLPQTGSQSLLASLEQFLRGKTLLLVLDNCEHVLGAAAQVGNLLAAAPKMKVLATSREPLNLLWEHVFPVSPLALPGLHRLPAPALLAETPAVALFLQRARAAQPHLQLTDQNARTVAEICHRLDGLPLAIELAAARVRTLSLEGLLGRLQRRLDLLTRGARDLPARHQTLRSAIDWSYSLLSADEQMCFRRLGVFVGGFTLAAAEATMEEQAAAPEPAERAGLDVLDHLTRLVEHSLVLTLQRQSTPRYRLLETIREYALERLWNGNETLDVQHRHAAYYLTFAEEAETHLRHRDQASWLDRLDDEHGNLRAALQWWAEQHGNLTAAERALRMGAALWRFWWVRGHLSEGANWLNHILALSRTSAVIAGDVQAVRAEATFGAGVLTSMIGDLDIARTHYEESLALWRAMGDDSGAAYTLVNLGEISWHLQDSQRAIETLERGVEISRAVDDRTGLAWALASYGMVAHDISSAPDARAHLEHSVTLFREVEDRLGLSLALEFLGFVVNDHGEPKAAHQLLLESLEIQRELGDRSGTALTLEAFAAVALSTGGPDQLARAVTLAGAAHALRVATGSLHWYRLQSRIDRRLDMARQALGESDFESLWEAGRALSVEEAVKQAMEIELNGPGNATPIATPPDADNPLSPREREVAALIAQGLTNRQIAEQLIITEGTAGVHVVHILNKLGLRSRAQIAAWAVRHERLSTDD